MLQILSRTSGLGTENAFVVLKEVNDLIAQGREIISFCIGQPDFNTPPNICEAGIEAIRDGRHGYTPSAGIPEPREAVAEYVLRTRGIEVKPDWVVIANGAKPFIGFTLLSVTDYGGAEKKVKKRKKWTYGIFFRSGIPMVVHSRDLTPASQSWPTYPGSLPIPQPQQADPIVS